MTLSAGSGATSSKGSSQFLRATVRRAREVIAERYRLHQVRIRPVGARSARFSLPCVVTAHRRGRPVRMFAKLIGSSDHFTAVTSQFLKNMFLGMNGRPAMFDVADSALGMARYQHERLVEFVSSGVPTSHPIGYHDLDGIRALLLMEFVHGTPFSQVELTPALAEEAFSVIRHMHQKRLYHGDIKLDNLMLSPERRVYLLDVGRFRDGTPEREQRAYDVASMLCALSERMRVEDALAAGALKYPSADQKAAVMYVELTRNRPDFFLPEEVVGPLKARLSAGGELLASVRRG
jgi:tRNA A-37 threonylcarbamoyl transferase component Bud32